MKLCHNTYEEMIEGNEYEEPKEEHLPQVTPSTPTTPNTPTRYVQTNHPKEHIIGDFRTSVQTIIRIAQVQEHTNYSLLYHNELKNIMESCKYEHWVKIHGRGTKSD